MCLISCKVTNLRNSIIPSHLNKQRKDHRRGTDRVTAHLWVVHVPQEEVALSVQDEVPPLELVTVLIFLYVQEATDTILTIDIRHSWSSLTLPLRRKRKIYCSVMNTVASQTQKHMHTQACMHACTQACTHRRQG